LRSRQAPTRARRQRLVERLGQVVVGPELDAAHDALQVGHGRDHDHRDVAQPLVGLDPGQRLDAAQDRHHHVE
jgi:hypothetical protein